METTTEPGTASVASPILARLIAAGFAAREATVQDVARPVPVAEFQLRIGAAQVIGYVYASDADAMIELKDFAQVERDAPDAFEVRRVGRVLYVGAIEKPAKLPMQKFLRIVDVGGDAE